MSIKSSILLRVRIAYIFIALFSALVVWKVFNIQFGQGEKWKKEEFQGRIKSLSIPATRGNVYADDKSLLATSVPYYWIRFDTKAIKDDEVYKENIEVFADSLARFFNNKSKRGYKTKKEYIRYLEKARKNNKRYLKLGYRRIKYHEKEEIAQWSVLKYVKGKKFGQLRRGIIYDKQERRKRPFKLLAKRTIGKIDSAGKGRHGIEYSFEHYLSGKKGKKVHEEIEADVWKPLIGEDAKKPEDGFDVHTSINVTLQDVSEMSLMESLKYNDAKSGCVVVMEVATGEIKAIANLSKQSDGEYREDYNYAVASAVNPGSTFKLAAMMALFEKCNISLTDKVNTDKGRWKFYDTWLTDSKPHGVITIKEGIELSSNIMVARLTDSIFNKTRIDQQEYLNFLRDFGFAAPVGFQLHGEAIPHIPKISSKKWSGITVPWMSIGYEIQVSPLQMLTFYNAIANNGKLLTPVLVKSINRAEEVVENFEAKVVKEKICSDETLDKIKVMLKGVVQNGTAKGIKDARYKIAGKTGTSKKVKDGRYVDEYYASFTGYFPADNPKYSCIVFVDDPKVHKHGGDVAAPVFKAIADKVYSMELDLHQAKKLKNNKVPGFFPVVQTGYYEELIEICDFLAVDYIKNNDATGFVKAQIVGEKLSWKKKSFIKNKVPDVNGMTFRDALPLLENFQLQVEYEGIGRVYKQSLLPGTAVQAGQTIKLWLQQ